MKTLQGLLGETVGEVTWGKGGEVKSAAYVIPSATPATRILHLNVHFYGGWGGGDAAFCRPILEPDISFLHTLFPILCIPVPWGLFPSPSVGISQADISFLHTLFPILCIPVPWGLFPSPSVGISQADISFLHTLFPILFLPDSWWLFSSLSFFIIFKSETFIFRQVIPYLFLFPGIG